MTQINIPSNSEAVKSRGFWLGYAYIKATGEDMQMLFNVFQLPKFQKLALNHMRIEMALYYLSKWSMIVEPVLHEHFSNLPHDAILLIKQQLQNGALSVMTNIPSAIERDDLLTAYHQYITFESKASFWNLLQRLGFSIDRTKCQPAMDRFEMETIDRTVLFCMLDSLTVSQEKVESDHQSMMAAYLQRSK